MSFSKPVLSMNDLPSSSMDVLAAFAGALHKKATQHGSAAARLMCVCGWLCVQSPFSQEHHDNPHFLAAAKRLNASDAEFQAATWAETVGGRCGDVDDGKTASEATPSSDVRTK